MEPSYTEFDRLKCIASTENQRKWLQLRARIPRRVRLLTGMDPKTGMDLKFCHIFNCVVCFSN